MYPIPIIRGRFLFIKFQRFWKGAFQLLGPERSYYFTVHTVASPDNYLIQQIEASRSSRIVPLYTTHDLPSRG
jgi:hypothetical protein